MIKVSPGKGRGVYSSKAIPRNTIIEVSPVLFFSKLEYEEHGKYTVLDHYTFIWPDGRMALALGLGSLFNHADPPNVSFTLDTSTDSIRYVTTRYIEPGEELCIFYGHKLWFSPAGATAENDADGIFQEDHNDDGWGGLSTVDYDESVESTSPINPFAGGDPDELVFEGDLPFTRHKLPPEEEEPDTVRTTRAWVVDVPDQRIITTLLKWLKRASLDTPDLAHLKRIRKQNNMATFLIAPQSAFPLEPPILPEDLNLPLPYLHTVPASSALTPIQFDLKTTLWPTTYTPRRKDEPESWSRGKASWAWQAMQKTIQAAVEASQNDEFPIAAHIPAPYEEASSTGRQDSPQSQGTPKEYTAHDTRKSANHPLRHAIINAIRKMADYQATSTISNGDVEPAASISQDKTDVDGSAPLHTGSNYLLTSLTLFTSHEPCVMCSMALLHSRVKEVIYFYPMLQTGACGSITCLPTLKGVNHRYIIAQWGGQRDIIETTAGKSNSTHRDINNAQVDSILDIGTAIDA
ncbi:cytidine deaminase-like protein [Macrolepiota fuliginosa MF-IS2]|uniref:Cytidine deaminase-like protein n=1 Tax=Macrolepiota fuliginosa MF-IS2 TaxID=1400762 RepID=A0A9P6C7G6_9AGAR|nr:cytidine deaminase-like protein [Macrolepiota fuliginosa MF-IS2]